MLEILFQRDSTHDKVEIVTEWNAVSQQTNLFADWGPGPYWNSSNTGTGIHSNRELDVAGWQAAHL